VANLFSHDVSVIDTSTDTVVAAVQVGDHPFGIAVTPDGRRVYVANMESHDISVIDTSSNTVVATISGFVQPREIAITPLH